MKSPFLSSLSPSFPSFPSFPSVPSVPSNLLARFMARVAVVLPLAIANFGLAPALHAAKGDRDNLEIKTPLVATVDAPAGASGKVELKADDRDGATRAKLHIETKGLLPATYTLSLMTASGTTPVVLGTFTVTGTDSGTGNGSDSDTETETETEGSGGGGGLNKSIMGGGEPKVELEDQDADANEQSFVFGGKGAPFPDGLDAFQIVSVSVATDTGVVVLFGDLSIQNSQQTMLNATQAIVPGVAAPSAQGKLTINARTKNGSEKAVVSLMVRKAPANLAFTINVNGTPVGQGVSSSRGDIRLKQNPGKHKGLGGFGQEISGLNLQSLSLTNANGDELLNVIR